VQAKIIKLVGLKNGGRLSPINLVTFAGTQNGEYVVWLVGSPLSLRNWEEIETSGFCNRFYRSWGCVN
jgi:hypothetical protein